MLLLTKDIVRARDDLCDPELGFFIWRSAFSAKTLQNELKRCICLMSDAVQVWERANYVGAQPMVHFRSHDSLKRTIRLYECTSNMRGNGINQISDIILQVRNQIERPWLTDVNYAKEQNRLQNFNITTYMIPSTGMLPRHADHDIETRFPLLQSLVPLVRNLRDFRGGEFTLFSRSGRKHRIFSDQELDEGDVLFFDKSLEHSVSEVHLGVSPSASGRWTKLFGVRAPISSSNLCDLKVHPPFDLGDFLPDSVSKFLD